MTEVPEHLLRRSQERRAALGLGGGGGGEAAPAASSDEPAKSTEVDKAPASTAPAEAPTPAAPAPAPPPPPYIEAALKRKRIPYWAMAMLAFLPFWAILYAGSLSPADTGGPTQLSLGGEIYASQCAACHGASGGGGVGRPLANGEVLKTFPTITQQLEFVAIGTAGVGMGVPYGNLDREGGPHTGGSFNGNAMPAFGESLTGAELLAVVRHERETLSGEVVPEEQLGEGGVLLWPSGEPMVDAAGELVTPSGQPLFTPEGRISVEVAATGGAAAPGQAGPGA